MTDPQATVTGSRPQIRVENASKSFAGRVVVDIDELILGDQPVEGLIGPNGAGKTTLMRMIMHSISLDRGTVTLTSDGNGRRVILSDLPPHRMAGHGVVKTNQVIMDFEKLTVLDSLLLSLATVDDERPQRIFREQELYDRSVESIEWYLDQFAFEDPLGFAKSAGEKKLLDIIRCLLLEPRVLLLDEPTAGLPDNVGDRLIALIKEKAAAENMAVVIVEHDLDVIWSMCDYVHFMAEGKVILHGEPDMIRENETVIEKYLGEGHV